MRDLTYTVLDGGDSMQIEASEVNGAGGMWHLYINRFFSGRFVIRAGRWEFHQNIPHNAKISRFPWWVTMAEILIMIEDIEKE